MPPLLLQPHNEYFACFQRWTVTLHWSIAVAVASTGCRQDKRAAYENVIFLVVSVTLKYRKSLPAIFIVDNVAVSGAGSVG